VSHAVYDTPERCYLGGHRLVRLDPPLHGWEFYCDTCQAMVITAAELTAHNAEPEDGAIGYVCALPLKERLRWSAELP